jgi:putative ABC transport system permease protein
MNVRQIRGWLARFFGMLNRGRREREFAEELESHLALHIEDNLRAGMSPEEARRVALVKLGGVTQVQELHREQRGLPMLETLFHDLRFGARMLFKNPGFTLIAVVTLALGIGANTAIFSVVNAVLLRPLPYPEPERLVHFATMSQEKGLGGASITDQLFTFYRDHSRIFESLAVYAPTGFNLADSGESERLRGANVTIDFFRVFGQQPIHGREFLPQEDMPGKNTVAILSYGLWQRRFGGDPLIVGKLVRLDSIPTVIVGIMPPRFNFPEEAELWVPVGLNPGKSAPWYLKPIGRLRPGITQAGADAEVKAVWRDYFRQRHGTTVDQADIVVIPLIRRLVGDVQTSLLVLFGAVCLVLLIAAANVANLLLARGAAREKEIVIRAALGANRWRVIRQLLTESLLLALIGGGLGLLLAWLGVDLLLKLAPEDLPRLQQIGIDGRIFGWTACVSLLTGLVFGLAPALQTSRLNLNESLKEGGRSATEGVGKRRWRNLLVVSELAMAVMLLIGAGLMVNSFWRLQQVDPGVDPRQALTMQIPLQGPRYAQPQQVNAFYDQFLERVKTLPGVRAAAVSNHLPPDLQPWSEALKIEGRTDDSRETHIACDIRVSPEYFQSLGARLLRGRYFSSTDSGNAPHVMVINETLARQYFPREDPLGKRINPGANPPDWFEIVGVVGDIKYNGLEAETLPAFYRPIAQSAWWSAFLIIKTEAIDPLSLTAAVRNEMRSLDRELPVTQISTLEQRFSKSVAQPRFRTTLVALFAMLALILASVGIYGVISYSVTLRTHELGIRIALGGRSRDVLMLVIRQGIILAVIGVAIGLSASFALTRLIKKLLYGVSETDPLTFIVVSLLPILVTLLACWLPARRAMKVDPIAALRYE